MTATPDQIRRYRCPSCHQTIYALRPVLCSECSGDRKAPDPGRRPTGTRPESDTDEGEDDPGQDHAVESPPPAQIGGCRDEAVLRRICKLLALADRGGTEEEAANAATRAAELLARYELDEAEIRARAAGTDVPPPEPIVTGHLVYRARRHIGWQMILLGAVAREYHCRPFYSGSNGMLFGRQSACEAAAYTWQYLAREVQRLADDGWRRLADHDCETPRSWKNAFRVACSQRIQARLRQARHARQQAEPHPTAGMRSRVTALTIVDRDRAEVNERWKTHTKGWGKVRTSAGSGGSSHDGYAAGRAAGDRVRLGGSRPGLKGAPRRLKP